MKNLCLIVLSLLVVSSSFAQTRKSKSSISITNEEKKFSLSAQFSIPIDEETKEAIIEEISDVLESEPEKEGRKSYIWEDLNSDDHSYIFRLHEKRCNIRIYKKGLNKRMFDRLCDLGEEVGDLLGSQSDKKASYSSKGSCSSKSKTKSHSSRNTTTSCSKNSLLNMSYSSAYKGEPTSVAISENASNLDLEATFSRSMLDKILEKIRIAVSDDSEADYDKQVWKDNKTNGGYKIKIDGTDCEIKLNKKTLSAGTFEKLEKLCIDISNLIMNGR